MSYNTRYTIDIHTKDMPREDMHTLVVNLRAFLALDSPEAIDAVGFCGPTKGPTTWYEHERDLKSLSIAFREVTLVLTGHGEEAGDIWRKYFHGGKVQKEKAQIVFAPFDLEKLR